MGIDLRRTKSWRQGGVRYSAIFQRTSAIVRSFGISLQKLSIIVEGKFRLPHLASDVVGIHRPDVSVLRQTCVVLLAVGSASIMRLTSNRAIFR